MPRSRHAVALARRIIRHSSFAFPCASEPFLTALGLNAVPAVGWFVGDWSAGTMLVLYWLETLLGTLLVAGRIILHRRSCRARDIGIIKRPQGQTPQTPQELPLHLSRGVPRSSSRLHPRPWNFPRRARLDDDPKHLSPEVKIENRPFARRVDRHRVFQSRRFHLRSHLAQDATLRLD